MFFRRKATVIAIHHRDDSDDASLLLDAMLAFRDGDFTARVPSNWTGVYGKIADVFNETIYMAQRLDAEPLASVAPTARRGSSSNECRVRRHWSWATNVESINTLIHDLVWPTAEVTRTIGAVARGDFGQPMALEVDGRPLEGEFLRMPKSSTT